MGFLKDLGEVTGLFAGRCFEATIEFVGSVVGSKSIENLGKQAFEASERAGEALGDIAENVAGGVVTAIKTASQQSAMHSGTSAPQIEKKANRIIDDFMMDD